MSKDNKTQGIELLSLDTDITITPIIKNRPQEKHELNPSLRLATNLAQTEGGAGIYQENEGLEQGSELVGLVSYPPFLSGAC